MASNCGSNIIIATWLQLPMAGLLARQIGIDEHSHFGALVQDPASLATGV